MLGDEVEHDRESVGDLSIVALLSEYLFLLYW